MSIDKSLKRKGGMTRTRCVMKRSERILKMMEDGKWADDRSPFGLNFSQTIRVIDELKRHGKLKCLKMLHYHQGSQIPKVSTIRLAAQEAAGAVDGIDDEDAFAVEAAGIVGGFLAEPAIIGAGLQQGRGQVTIDQDIGFADRRGIVLGPALDVAPEEAAGNDAGRYRRGAEQFEIIAVGGGGRWHRRAF